MPEDEGAAARSGEEENHPKRQVVEPYTCVACGCLCDDVRLVIDGGRIVEARSVCEMGRAALVGLEMEPPARPSARVRGVSAEIEAALDEASRILAGARAPVIVGLDRSTNETVGRAVALGDRIGAVVEVGDPALAATRISAFQRSGRVSATLGEVKNRADVVVFWGTDPIVTHPRHWERYSVEPVGRFVPEGRAGRTVVVIDQQRTATAERADLFLPVAPENELEVLSVLRALACEVELDTKRVEAATGCDFSALLALAELLRGAQYGAWFSGSLAGRGPVDQAEARHQAVTGLVRELNRGTRFVSLGMGEAGNAHGAEAVLAWQTGLTPSVDLGAGYPEALPGATSAVDRLARGEVDCVLVVGDVSLDSWPIAARERLSRVPLLFIGPPENPVSTSALVAFSAGTMGLDENGAVTRVDGVSLPVRAIRPRQLPTEREWLDSLLKRIEPSSVPLASASHETAASL